MSLRTVLIGFATLLLVMAFAAGTIYFNRGVADYSHRTSELAVEVRGTALAEMLARSLAEEWADVQGFALSINPGLDSDQLQAAIDGYQDAGGKISWAGVARTNGTVVAATENLLVGESVSQRPWFQRGLEGPFAGDVHEAVLLADLIAPDAMTPPRFIDFALPLANAQEQVRGVFGVHINWSWVQELLADMATSLDVDAFLLDRSGTLLISTDPDVEMESVRSLASFRAASLVSTGSFVEQWPDGVTYYSFIVPDVGLTGVPSFGWSLVLRLDPSPIGGAQSEFGRFMMLGGGLIALAGILALALVFSIFLRPLSTLVDATSRLSKGEEIGFVQGSMLYREVARLTNALARFQTQDADRRKSRRPEDGGTDSL